jgi:hypothetical protein
VPLTTTIRYSAADLRLISNEDRLVLRWWDGHAWLDATALCGPAAHPTLEAAVNRISTPICRAGQYALFGPTNQVYLPAISSW